MMKFLKHIVSGCFLFVSLANATTTKETFAKFPNEYFIETGSFQGDGIQKALDAGFKNVYSIEMSRRYYKHCKRRFANRPEVTVFFGDSAEVLPQIIKDINVPITFWLDGHYCGAGTAHKDTYNPILLELECIKQHHIKTHTILIDDVRLFGTFSFDWITLDDIINKLLEVNGNYSISFEDGYEPADVIVAQIL